MQPIRLPPRCENCEGRGFLILKSKENIGTAINSKEDYEQCPICGGSGEKVWTNWESQA